jgi:hypothetical protein
MFLYMRVCPTAAPSTSCSILSTTNTVATLALDRFHRTSFGLKHLFFTVAHIAPTPVTPHRKHSPLLSQATQV